MTEVFDHAEGSIYDRARSAVREVLHAPPDFIDEKAEALESVKSLIEELRNIAASYEK